MSKKKETKKICIITTGGTIAMKYDPESNGVVPSIHGKTLISYLPQDIIPCDIDIYEYSNKPSPHMTIQDMQEISLYIQVNSKNYNGFVVTHGTDILEETAFFLDLTLPTKINCAVTASMRSNDELGVDGPRNLAGAIKTMLSSAAKQYGVLVVLNDEIHDPLTVTKTYTSNVSTFNSPGFGILGYVDDDKVLFRRKKIQKLTLSAKYFEEKISLYKTYVGDTGEYLEHLSGKEDLQGLVIEGFGRGNVPPHIRKPIEKLIKKKVPVIISTRCHIGRTLGVYSYEGGGKDLLNMGAILSGDLKPHKAYLLLGLLLGKGYTFTQIKNVFSLF